MEQENIALVSYRAFTLAFSDPLKLHRIPVPRKRWILSLRTASGRESNTMSIGWIARKAVSVEGGHLDSFIFGTFAIDICTSMLKFRGRLFALDFQNGIDSPLSLGFVEKLGSGIRYVVSAGGAAPRTLGNGHYTFDKCFNSNGNRSSTSWSIGPRSQ